MTPISTIIGDLIPLLGEPLPELDRVPVSKRLENLADAWAPYQIPPPSPAVLNACLRIADETLVIRIANRLGWEGQLRRYSRGDRFLELVRLFVGSIENEGAA